MVNSGQFWDLAHQLLILYVIFLFIFKSPVQYIDLPWYLELNLLFIFICIISFTVGYYINTTVDNIQICAKKGTKYIWASQTESYTSSAASFEVLKQTFLSLIKGRIMFTFVLSIHIRVLIVEGLLHNLTQNLSAFNDNLLSLSVPIYSSPIKLTFKVFLLFAWLGCKTNTPPKTACKATNKWE